MPGNLPNGVVSGQIYRKDRYYKDASGSWQGKYLLVLAAAPSGDVIHRLLTSRQHGRPKTPPCSHGDPYPSFFLGYLGGALTSESWLDLRGLEDYDESDFADHKTNGVLTLALVLDRSILCAALDCTAGADDTSMQQARSIRDERSLLGCF